MADTTAKAARVSTTPLLYLPQTVRLIARDDVHPPLTKTALRRNKQYTEAVKHARYQLVSADADSTIRIRRTFKAYPAWKPKLKVSLATSTKHTKHSAPVKAEPPQQAAVDTQAEDEEEYKTAASVASSPQQAARKSHKRRLTESNTAGDTGKDTTTTNTTHLPTRPLITRSQVLQHLQQWLAKHYKNMDMVTDQYMFEMLKTQERRTSILLDDVRSHHNDVVLQRNSKLLSQLWQARAERQKQQQQQGSITAEHVHAHASVKELQLAREFELNTVPLVNDLPASLMMSRSAVNFSPQLMMDYD